MAGLSNVSTTRHPGFRHGRALAAGIVAWITLGGPGGPSPAPAQGYLAGPPRLDPPAVLVRLQPGATPPAGAVGLGQASNAPRASLGAPAALEALAATPDLAARAVRVGVAGVEAPFGRFGLVDDPANPDAPSSRLARTYRLVLPAGADPRTAASLLGQAAEVELAEPDALYHAMWIDGAHATRPSAGAAPKTGSGAEFLPDDPFFTDGTQWGLSNSGVGPYGGVSGTDIHAPQGWAITTGSAATILAIVDTGFDLHHPELNRDLADGTPRVIQHYNSSVEGEFATADDSVGHGTIVAGVALAMTNNGPVLDGTGVAGVCGGSGGDSLGCRVIEVKATPTHYTDALGSELANGIVFAAARGARAINLSFGGDEDNNDVREAIAYAASLGAVVVCGAGNGQDATPQYPGYYARYGLGVSVAALTSDGSLARFSSRGPQIDVAAPGQDIMSTYLTYENAYASPLRDFAESSGTSFAAPFVTGLAGLAYTLQPTMRDNEFQEMLRRTARDVGDPGRDDTYGWGVPDAPALLTALAPPRGFLRGRARAQSWALVSTDSVTVSKSSLSVNGCSPDGRYLAERWEVRTHVDLPAGRMLETPEVIVRKNIPILGLSGSTGWGPGPLLEYNVGWGELVPGTATPSGFDVRAYVYRIPVMPQNGCASTTPIDFIPVRPEDVFFEWSAFGRLDAPPVLTVDTPQDGATIGVDDPSVLSFHASDTDTVSTIQIAYSVDGGVNWGTVATLPGDATSYAFKSPCAQTGRAYRLRFRAIDSHGGWSDQSEVIRAYVPARECLDGENPDAPGTFAFLPVAPNPTVGGRASFHLDLPEGAPGAASAKITIFDLRGRLVRELVLPGTLVGPVAVTWDGLDRAGRVAPAGVYLARLSAGGHEATQRFVRVSTGAQ